MNVEDIGRLHRFIMRVALGVGLQHVSVPDLLVVHSFVLSDAYRT